MFFCVLTGFILKFPIWGDPADDNCFDDEAYWEVMALSFHQMVILSSCCKLGSSVGSRFPRMRKPSRLCWNTTTTWSTSTRTCKLTADTLFRSPPPLAGVTELSFYSTELRPTSQWNKVRTPTELSNMLLIKDQPSEPGAVPDLPSCEGLWV